MVGGRLQNSVEIKDRAQLVPESNAQKVKIFCPFQHDGGNEKGRGHKCPHISMNIEVVI